MTQNSLRTGIVSLSLLCAACSCAGGEKDNIDTMERNGRLVVVAHRGGADLGPENTLGCIELGLQAGAGWIEVDVHLSADGEIVVCHDPTVDRTTDGSGYISEMEYSEIALLRALDKDGNPTAEHVPTLDEVLGLIDGRAGLLLEIKHSRHSLEGIERACIDCVRRHGATDSVIIQSFDDSVIETVHRMAPEIKVEKLLFHAVSANFDFQKYDYVNGFNVYHRLLSRSFTEKAHSLGKQVKSWTVNDAYDRSLDFVDGVISNSPGLFTKGR